MVRTALKLLIALVLVGAASGPVLATAAAADTKKCRSGYHLRTKRGVKRCVRRPKQPERPRDAVTPASIELIVATLKQGGFGATGFMRFAGVVDGTAYGEWILSNGVARERFPFRLRVSRTDYTPFTIGYPLKAFTSGKTVTARLVIGKVSSNSVTVKQTG